MHDTSNKKNSGSSSPMSNFSECSSSLMAGSSSHSLSSLLKFKSCSMGGPDCFTEAPFGHVLSLGKKQSS